MKTKKIIAVLLILVFSFSVFGNAEELSAKAKKPQLPKKVSLNVSKSKTIKISNLSKVKIKKTAWKLNNKKTVRIVSKTKNKVKIKALRQGTVKLTATVKAKNKKYKIKSTIKVTKKPDKIIPTTKPSAKPTEKPSQIPTVRPTYRPAGPIEGSLKDTYEPIFGKMGSAVTPRQMRSASDLAFIKSQYNSITMENDMKPNGLLGGGWGDLPTLDAMPVGYVENEKYEYKDDKYMDLNFSVVDEMIEIAYQNGLKMRYHVLVWHNQTPTAFFREGFKSNGAYVDKDTMNGRMEYYIRNVIHHIYNTEHGKDVIYSWDVVNEYTHNNNGNAKCDWDQVYYPEYTFSKDKHSRIYDACYVNDAFEIADDQLNKLEAAGKIEEADDITLLYNDFNEYFERNEIVELIRNINKNKKLCDGVGMQMHLDVTRPDPSATGEIAAAIDLFTAEGLEIQITELDVTFNYDYDSGANNKVDFTKRETLEQQCIYYDTLFRTLLDKKKQGAKITGITFWGLYDTISWRSNGKPLVFSSMTQAKASYFAILDAVRY